MYCLLSLNFEYRILNIIMQKSPVNKWQNLIVTLYISSNENILLSLKERVLSLQCYNQLIQLSVKHCCNTILKQYIDVRVIAVPVFF